MENKQTAIEWLVEKIQQGNPSFKFDALIRQAKKMEKEQIMDFTMKFMMQDRPIVSFYNETFKSE